MHDCLFDSSLANYKLSYISKYISVTYALDSVHKNDRRMNRSRSFAVLSDKPSRIERYSRPEYKSADSIDSYAELLMYLIAALGSVHEKFDV